MEKNVNITSAGFFSKLSNQSNHDVQVKLPSDNVTGGENSTGFNTILTKSLENNADINNADKDGQPKNRTENGNNPRNSSEAKNVKKDNTAQNTSISPSHGNNATEKLTKSFRISQFQSKKEEGNTEVRQRNNDSAGENSLFAGQFMNTLNTILKNLERLSSSAPGERTDDFSDIARSSGKKLKDIFDKLKNSLSMEDVKKAMTELEKLTADPQFKKLLQALTSDNENTGITVDKLKNLSQMMEKFKNLLSSIDDASIGTAREIIKALQKGELETGHKDFRLIQGRHRIVENESRHRDNHENTEQRSHHNTSQKNEQIPRPLQVTESVQNVQNIDTNVKFSQLIETHQNANTQNVSYREPVNVPRDMLSQVVKNARIATSEGKKEISFQIEPREFGKIRLNLSIENEHVTARIAVESDKVHKFLNENRSELIKQLQNAGLTVDNVDIQMQNNGQQSSNLERHIENMNSQNNEINRTGSAQVNESDTAQPEPFAYPEFSESIYNPDWLASEINLTI